MNDIVEQKQTIIYLINIFTFIIIILFNYFNKFKIEFNSWRH